MGSKLSRRKATFRLSLAITVALSASGVVSAAADPICGCGDFVGLKTGSTEAQGGVRLKPDATKAQGQVRLNSDSTKTHALAPFTASVVGVDDGDSITVLRNGERVRVRIEGIDCPERDQDFSRQARAFTTKLLLHRTAQIRPVTVDAYERIVARVRLDGTDVGQALVGAGLAWHYTHYSFDPALARAEASAKAAHRGLWSAPSPIPPWNYRQATREDERAPQRPSSGNPGVRAPAREESTPRSPGPRAVAPREGTAYHGNVNSLVFHALGCPYYNCSNCQRIFTSIEQAEAAGYRPHRECVR